MSRERMTAPRVRGRSARLSMRVEQVLAEI